MWSRRALSAGQKSSPNDSDVDAVILDKLRVLARKGTAGSSPLSPRSCLHQPSRITKMASLTWPLIRVTIHTICQAASTLLEPAHTATPLFLYIRHPPPPCPSAYELFQIPPTANPPNCFPQRFAAQLASLCIPPSASLLPRRPLHSKNLNRP